MHLMVLLVVAVILGGGGSRAGFNNLFVELCGFAVLASHGRACAAFFARGPLGLRVLAGASILLAGLQLIPLPPALWQALPGRDLVVQSLALIDGTHSWFPFSLARNRTALALLAMIATLPVLCIGLRLDDRQAGRAAFVFVGLGFVNALIGVVQLASANRVGNLYPGGQASQLYGTFNNHNSTGLFFVVVLALLLQLRQVRGMRRSLLSTLRLAGAGFLCVAILLTRSRSSIALLCGLVLVYLPPMLLALRASLGPQFGKAVAAGLLVVVLAGGGVAWLGHNSLGKTAVRFQDFEDRRPLIWADAVENASRFMPLGAGMGAFDEVFQLDESLEHLSGPKARRAHNDYLEVAVEAGLPGLVLLVGWLAWTTRAVWTARRLPDRSLRLGAGAGLACIAAQSLVDYPLRSLGMLISAAFLVALLARRPDAARVREAAQRPDRTARRTARGGRS